MAIPTINFKGFLYDDAGDAISGATINLYAKNSTTTSLASDTTDSNGAWDINYTTAGTAGLDIQISSGDSKRRIKYDDKIHLAELDTALLNIRAVEGGSAIQYYYADEGEDAGDRWRVQVADGGVMTFANDINSQNSYVTHVTITPNSTVASSTFAIAGAATVGGSLNISTVAAAGGDTDKFLVLDSSGNVDYRTGTQVASDIGAITSGVSLSGSTNNTVVTVTGANATQGEANLTFDGSTLAVTGDLTVSGGDGALQFTNAGENSIKIPDNQASALIIEEANNAYMTFVSSNSSEKITFAKALDIDAAVQIDSTVTVGVDDTGHDVKFFGASSGAYFIYDQSEDQVEIRGAAADATTSTGKLLLTTALTDINANDVIGKVSFQAPLEAGGTDAITIAASIEAVAQGTFSASVNATDIIFKTGHSEAATEKFRFTSQGEIGIGGTNYGTDGQVLTSAGGGAAAAWEDAGGGGGTFEAVAKEDIVAGAPVALVNDSGTVKVENIYGVSDSIQNLLTSYDALGMDGNDTHKLIYCADVDKIARVFLGTSYYMGVQIADYNSTTKELTWGAPVMITSASSYPINACWDEDTDRIVIVGGSGTSRALQAHVYMISGSADTVVTSDSGTDYEPGTAFAITSEAGHYLNGLHVEYDKAENTVIVLYKVDGGSNANKVYATALTITGSSTNTAADNIADTELFTTGGNIAFQWNSYGDGAGLITYNDSADSSYYKARGIIHNNTAFTTNPAVGASAAEPMGADNKATPGGYQIWDNPSISADTSNGNFVCALDTWDAGNNYVTVKIIAMKVSTSDGAITASGTPYDGMGDGQYSLFAGLSSKLNALGGFSEGSSERFNFRKSDFKSQIEKGWGRIQYDPDMDCHVAIYRGKNEILLGEEEYLHGAAVDSGDMALIFLITLGGTNDVVLTVTEHDYWMAVQRGGSYDAGQGYYTSGGQGMVYDTTNDQMIFHTHHGSVNTFEDMNSERSTLVSFKNGSTKEKKYGKSNMNKFIGFNTTAVDISSSTAATITVAGGLNENQSSLTVGAEYWIGDGGILRDAKPLQSMWLYKAGIATAATKLLVQNYYLNTRV